MGLIKNSGVLITQNRFSKDDNGMYGVGRAAAGRRLWNKDKLHNWRQQDEIQRLNKRVDIFVMT
jgi:N-methylhydantoinase B/oxoprolinase/acetone carboxylase alpha subunit